MNNHRLFILLILLKKLKYQGLTSETTVRVCNVMYMLFMDLLRVTGIGERMSYIIKNTKCVF